MSGPQEGDTVVECKPASNVVELRKRTRKERWMDDWRRNLRFSVSGNDILGDVANVTLAFEHAPELQGLLRYNELARRVELTRAPPWRTLTRGTNWRDDDDVDLLGWLQTKDIPARGDGTIARIVHAQASKNAVHPVRRWLSELVWDNEPLMTGTLIDALCAKGDRDYLGGVLRRFMISAVARVMRPGCKADHMLVLVGAQGGGKSTFARILGGQWAIESHSTFGSKDAAQELDGAWIVEIAELSGMRRSEVETVKTFVSKVSDHYRPAYGRHVIDQPRSCVFLGTTNEDRFLVDYTGNRRFWPVRCIGQLDLKLLEAHREQLWAEAMSAYRANEQWYLTPEEERLAREVQEDHRVVGQVEEEVVAFLELRLLSQLPMKHEVTVRGVYEGICGERDVNNLSLRRQMETAIGQAIRKAGWVYVGRRGVERRTTYAYQEGKGDN